MKNKRKMVLKNLLNNSISAYFSAVEIHNKPKIDFRYETVSLLLITSWELILKAYIRKYCKNESIYDDKNSRYTKKLSECLKIVSKHLGKNKFKFIEKNIEKIEEYRNSIVHYYDEDGIKSGIFMLISKCAINYTSFINEYFGKDILEKENLFILPLGFKLPFRPEEFLSHSAIDSISSKEVKEFMESIVKIVREMKDEGIEESIVLGFDLQLKNIKQITNPDLIVAIDQSSDNKIISEKKVKLSSEKGSQSVHLSDNEVFELYPYGFKKLSTKCKETIPGFKETQLHELKKKIFLGNAEFSYERFAYPSAKKPNILYSEKAFEKIKEFYLEKN